MEIKSNGDYDSSTAIAGILQGQISRKLFRDSLLLFCKKNGIYTWHTVNGWVYDFNETAAFPGKNLSVRLAEKLVIIWQEDMTTAPIPYVGCKVAICYDAYWSDRGEPFEILIHKVVERPKYRTYEFILELEDIKFVRYNPNENKCEFYEPPVKVGLIDSFKSCIKNFLN
jgi:hypothetical protein